MMCKINMRPVQEVDYNTHQLSDMFERLNKRVTEEMTQMRKEMEQLRLENIELREQLQTIHTTTTSTQTNGNCFK